MLTCCEAISIVQLVPTIEQCKNVAEINERKVTEVKAIVAPKRVN
jgi:hypothetical protein